MAKANLPLIDALRKAAQNLENGNQYMWGHHGSCNCGNLLQAATNLSKKEILEYAQTGNGEWSELAEDYCGIIEAPYQFLIAKLGELGLNPVDVHNIEYLSDSKVLKNLEGGFRNLERNKRENVISYFLAYADLLEKDLEADKAIKELIQAEELVIS
jgi:hypothetical protein